jgi:hypothetical protein
MVEDVVRQETVTGVGEWVLGASSPNGVMPRLGILEVT